MYRYKGPRQIRPKNKLIHIIAIVVAIGMFGGWAKDDVGTLTQSSEAYKQLYPYGTLQRLDTEGHAVEEHVGKSDAYLRHRLETENISAASTFYNMVEADKAVRMVLAARHDLIQEWLKTDKSDRKAFYYPSSEPVGRVWDRTNKYPFAGNQVRVVLVRDGDYPEGFHILTAYPEIK